MLNVWQLSTKRRDELLEITEDVRIFDREAQLKEGYALIICPHTIKLVQSAL